MKYYFTLNSKLNMCNCYRFENVKRIQKQENLMKYFKNIISEVKLLSCVFVQHENSFSYALAALCLGLTRKILWSWLHRCWNLQVKCHADTFLQCNAIVCAVSVSYEYIPITCADARLSMWMARRQRKRKHINENR